MTKSRLPELNKEREELDELHFHAGLLLAHAGVLVEKVNKISSDLRELATKIRHMAITKEAECHEVLETLMKGEQQ